MTTITTNNRTLLFVEVPEDASMFAITPNGNLRFVTSESHIYKGVKLEQVTAKFIATTDKITEEQAAMFVEPDVVEGLFKHAASGTICNVKLSTSALNRFKCLLQHHSITGRHAIIEQL